MIGLIYHKKVVEIILGNRNTIMWYSAPPKKEFIFLQYKKTMLESKVLEALRKG